LLFQGQEFAASTPFCYFHDCPAAEAPRVAEGRTKFLSQFPTMALPDVQSRFPDPAAVSTFEHCKLDFSEREKHAPMYLLHKDALALRRNDPLVGSQIRGHLDAAALERDTFVIRYFGSRDEDRLLVVNFDRDLHFDPAPEPLLAPPAGRRWKIVWSSEDPRYGGRGTPELDTDEGWRIPGDATVLLQATPESPAPRGGAPCPD
jgi:maltooligosyltrehalose trehalohydrolase